MELNITATLEEQEKANIAEIKQMLEILLKKDNQKAWLTDEMVIERFSISKTTLFRWRQEGFPFCQEESIRRYIPAEVDEWFSQFKSSNILKAA